MHEPSPPPYTSSESTTRPQPPSQLFTSATTPGYPAPASSYLPYPQNQHFGPTPLGAQQLNAPYAYYDPWSPYSMTQADVRARRRFIASVLWGVVIWCMIGFLLGAEVVEYAKQRWS